MKRSTEGRGALSSSPVLPAYGDDCPYPHVVESGSPDARYAVVERGAAGWTAEMFTVPYPHQQMAELARMRNCLDWERALLTGYM